jgi:hypothetical protein
VKIRSKLQTVRAALLGSALVLGHGAAAVADEADARAIMSSMTDYVLALDALSFDFDEYLEIVTDDGERLGLAGSGVVSLVRPDKIRVTRNSGFTNSEMVFDGQSLSVFDATSGLYAEQEVPGTLEQLVDKLRDDFGRPLPAADLLTGAGHGSLIERATEIKDLGVGVISGTTCDHFAFRGEEVDWQIWVAQGDKPYPCMLIITTQAIAQAPQYRIQVRDWRESSDNVDFAPEKPGASTQVDMAEYLEGARSLPENYGLETGK